jgi:hypothetical protein
MLIVPSLRPSLTAAPAPYSDYAGTDATDPSTLRRRYSGQPMPWWCHYMSALPTFEALHWKSVGTVDSVANLLSFGARFGP